MKNTPILYGLIGLLLGSVLTHLYISSMFHAGPKKNWQSSGMMHQMPDGSMMGGDNTMDAMMGDMMMGLEGKTGDAFDKAFLSTMIVHHEGAVVMAEAVLKTSKRPELIKLAQEIIAAQNKEISSMKAWQASWFAPKN